MLQKRAEMRTISVFLVLVAVTAHTSLAKKLTPCQFLKELRKYGVPGNEQATCEFNILQLYVFISYETSVCVSNFPK
jgi:hypothetical protein